MGRKAKSKRGTPNQRDITTPENRDKLPASKHPYFTKIAKGQSVGYLNGRWFARYRDGGKYVTHELNVVATPAKQYSLAVQEALKLIEETRESDTTLTVQKAIDRYADHLKLHNSEDSSKRTKGQLVRHVPDSIKETLVALLTKEQVTDWHHSLVKGEGDDQRRSKDSANRVLSQLKACLNLAYDTGLVYSNRAWATVKPFKGVSAGRPLLLTDEQVTRMLDKASGGFKDLLTLSILTGARYGELNTLTVKDFEGGRLRLNGKTGERLMYLSDEAQGFLKRLCKNKLPNAYLLTKDDGTPWGRSHQTRPMNRLIKSAKLPRDTVFYSLRHYYISKQIMAGISIQFVADQCGTSVRMIEQTYGKTSDDYAWQAVNAVNIL